MGMGVNGQPIVQYYVHPGAYAPFPYYAHPGAPAYAATAPHQGVPQPPPQQQQHQHGHATTMDPTAADGQKKAGADAGEMGVDEAPATAPAGTKKKKGAKGGEGKVKKAKPRTQKAKEMGGEVLVQ